MLKHNISASFVVGNSQTNPIYTNEDSLIGLVFTGGSIAATGSQVSFMVSPDGTNYYPLFDYNGTEVTMPVSASNRAYNLNHDVFESWNYVKIRLGTSTSAVLQTTYDLSLTLIAARGLI